MTATAKIPVRLAVRVASVGWAVPDRVETAGDVGLRTGWSADAVIAATGVHERRICDEPVETLAARAARRALGSGPPPDLLIHAAATPRQVLPDTSVFVARELGWSAIPTVTLHASCLSFLVALQHASALIHAGVVRRVLITSAEIATVGRNDAEPESACLLGDGAGAAVVEASTDPNTGLHAWFFGTWPQWADLASVRGGGVAQHPLDPRTPPDACLFRMDGPALFRHAFRATSTAIRRVLSETGLSPEDIRLVVPHQPSGRAVAALQRFGFRSSQIVDIVGQYGNCLAASLPMALAIGHECGAMQRGDRVLFVGTGAGLSVGVVLLTW